MEGHRKVYQVLVGKSERKRPVGKPRCRWEDRIKWISGKLAGRVWSGFSWLRIGADGGLS
jgi:hypothetical protein